MTKAGVTGAASERVVPIPSIAVFSELPFARVGTIGNDLEPSLSESAELVDKIQGKQKPGKTRIDGSKTRAAQIPKKKSI